jgi:hypothetical protein
MSEYRETLRGHGHPIFLRDDFRCRYCDFDGREFLAWMQLSLDHIIPRNAGGSDAPENLATCCRSCNSITSRMKFQSGVTQSEAIGKKRERVLRRHKECLEFWKAEVVESYLHRHEVVEKSAEPGNVNGTSLISHQQIQPHDISHSHFMPHP